MAPIFSTRCINFQSAALCQFTSGSDITDLADVGVDAAIVRGIVSIAHKLDLEVIVEGVETQTQCELLRDMGCDVVQGHLLGRGLPPTAFAAAYFGKTSEPSGRWFPTAEQIADKSRAGNSRQRARLADEAKADSSGH
jgi:predicted signal transduction protein with EAL and GGDEF domain